MSNWTGLGIGTKNSEGDWIEMFFAAAKNISIQSPSLFFVPIPKPVQLLII